MPRELRNAPRVTVRIPTLIEKIGEQPVVPDLALAPHFDRVAAEPTDIGMKVPGIIVDLSVNGAFIAAYPLPLLSRVTFTFPLGGFGQVDAVGWVFWRRTADTTMELDGRRIDLPAGIGVLFEAMPADARQEISRLVQGSRAES